MKILYDHQAFTMQYYGGVSKCFCELIKHKQDDVNCEISIVQSNNTHLRESNIIPNLQAVNFDFHSFLPNLNFKGKHWIYKNFISCIDLFHAAEKVNENISLCALKKGNFDIFHPTFFSDYFLPHINNKPFVITIHDMTPEIYPEYFLKPSDESHRKKNLCEKATAIIAVSHQTKYDLMRIFGIEDKKIHVVYHGSPNVMTFGVKGLIDGEYFLYVGQRNAYKNFSQTLIDFSVFHSKHKDVKFVCTGSPFNKKEQIEIAKLNLQSNVIYVKVSDCEMMALYQNAIAFIYPSLYEGFGMPILEAFANKCPVLLNKKSCFPEIGGDAALYFESECQKSNLVEIMEYIYNCTSTERIDIKEKGYNRSKDFTWEQSAKYLSEAYNKCI